MILHSALCAHSGALENVSTPQSWQSCNSNYLLNAYELPGTALGAGGIAWNKAGKASALMEFRFWHEQ